ncbi:MAG: hypothetical protein QJT81_19760 [Candidatus Thiothrix putei]|uniref:Uncharacterized protein n=1 Tax=Candidatus Thiothrix putei TaxID=3080811 RepID=A0AA95HAR0_9GAMM|nr:MAG: hypothetical protein QJT81_19760 [Candidatus Thiothrix putei]
MILQDTYLTDHKYPWILLATLAVSMSIYFYPPDSGLVEIVRDRGLELASKVQTFPMPTTAFPRHLGNVASAKPIRPNRNLKKAQQTANTSNAMDNRPVTNINQAFQQLNPTNENRREVYTVATLTQSTLPEQKLLLIEQLLDSKEMIGKTGEVYNLLLNENNPVIIKSLSRLLMSSFDENTDVVGVLSTLVTNDKIAADVIDYIPEFLSPEEIRALYVLNNNQLSIEQKDMLLTYYINTSILNAEDPFADAYMNQEYQYRRANLAVSPRETLALALVTGRDNLEYVAMQKSHFSTRLILREKPLNPDQETLFMWFEANLIISEDDADKALFIEAMSYELTNEEKQAINLMYPMIF